MSPRELRQNLDDLFEGHLEGEAFTALEKELRESAEARATYRECLLLHKALEFRGKGVDLFNVVPMEEVVQRRQKRYLRNAGVAAAAVLVLALTIMAVVLTRTPAPTVTFLQSPGTDLTISHDISTEKAPQGNALNPGSRLEIRRGSVEVTFASGVHGIIQGPADLTVHRADMLFLAEGTAWFEVPRKAIGFKVTTPDLILTDLGTEFGILSRTRYLDEVHVFDGKVQVVNRNGLKKEEQLEAGQARIAGPAGRWNETELDGERFLRELPETHLPLIETDVVIDEESSLRELAYEDDVSSSDLLHGMIPKAHGWNMSPSRFRKVPQAEPRELSDGVHGAQFHKDLEDLIQGAYPHVGATAEYELGLGSHGQGFDITSIQSIADWNSAGFGNQAWAVEVRRVGGEWVELAQVECSPFTAERLTGGGCSKVVLTGKSGILARGVEAIRFTAGAVPTSAGNSFIWREVDVFGQPSEK